MGSGTSNDRPMHLEPSALGTKDHWDEAYTRELDNHTHDSEDEGTIWFEDSGAEEKMIEYLETLPLHGGAESNEQNEALRIVDLGTGNGHMLFALQDEGWRAEMVGLDYSEASVRLAQQIQTRRVRDEEGPDLGDKLRFRGCDILATSMHSDLHGAFDVALDKGTLDAISLSSATDTDGRRGCEVYAARASALLKPGGYLLVTSCNWTSEELRKWFDGPELEWVEEVPFPSFQFGGQKGQTVSCVCFGGRRRVWPMLDDEPCGIAVA